MYCSGVVPGVQCTVYTRYNTCTIHSLPPAFSKSPPFSSLVRSSEIGSIGIPPGWDSSHGIPPTVFLPHGIPPQRDSSHTGSLPRDSSHGIPPTGFLPQGIPPTQNSSHTGFLPQGIPSTRDSSHKGFLPEGFLPHGISPT